MRFWQFIVGCFGHSCPREVQPKLDAFRDCRHVAAHGKAVNYIASMDPQRDPGQHKIGGPVDNDTDHLSGESIEQLAENAGMIAVDRVEFAVLFPGRRSAVMCSSEEFEAAMKYADEGTIALVVERLSQ